MQSFPKKYWWTVLIATPLLTALIAIVPKLFSESGSGGDSITISGSDIGGNVQIVGTQHILNEIEQIVSDPAEFQELKKSVEKAINLVKGGFNEGAIEAFEKIAQQHELASVYSNIGALQFEAGNQVRSLQAYETAMSLNPDSDVLINNLATLYEQQGRTDEAMRQLERVKHSDLAKQSLNRLSNDDKSVPVLLFESEDNGAMDSANLLDVGTTVKGSISSSNDWDVYRISLPKGPRDYIRVKIKPLDGKLQAAFRWHDKNWKMLNEGVATTAGQVYILFLTGSPDEAHFVSVSGAYYGTAGDYNLSVESLHAYDGHEPNESILESTDMGQVTRVNGSILDTNDIDFYAFDAAKVNTQFRLINEATELQPTVELWGSDKARLNRFSANNVSQNLNGELVLGQVGKFYLSVTGTGNGAYTLVFE